MGNFVYKYVHNNEIIYIGKCNGDLKTRTSAHGKKGDNIPEYAWDEINNSEIWFTKLANATMSDVVESELIRRYQPKYNISKKKTDWSGLPFIEPQWERLIPTNLKIVKHKKNTPDFQNLYKSLIANAQTKIVIYEFITKMHSGESYAYPLKNMTLSDRQEIINELYKLGLLNINESNSEYLFFENITKEQILVAYDSLNNYKLITLIGNNLLQ